MSNKPKNLTQKVEIFDVGPVQSTDTNAEGAIAIEQLERLKSDPAWQIISKFYQEKTESLESVVFKDPAKLTREEKENLNLFIIKRNMSFQFGHIIDILIKGIEIKKSMSGKVNLDPYADTDTPSSIDLKGLV